MRQLKNHYVFILVAVLLVAAMLLRNISSASKYQNGASDNKVELNRTEPLILSRHAKCRMDCRHITEAERKEILKEGTINYNKSQPDNSRGPVYAVEGITHANQ